MTIWSVTTKKVQCCQNSFPRLLGAFYEFLVGIKLKWSFQSDSIRRFIALTLQNDEEAFRVLQLAVWQRSQKVFKPSHKRRFRHRGSNISWLKISTVSVEEKTFVWRCGKYSENLWKIHESLGIQESGKFKRTSKQFQSPFDFSWTLMRRVFRSQVFN